MNADIDLIFFGDSLTYGYGVSKENSWVYRSSNELHINYLNKAQNGDTTPSMLSRYYSDVLRYKPPRIFIMGGTNDLLCGRSVASIIENIEIMIKDAFNIDSKVILGIPPDIIPSMAEKLFMPSSFYNYTEQNLSKLRTELIDLSNKYNTGLIDFYSLGFTKDLYIDGLHLTSKGNEIMFKEAIKMLE